VNGDLALLAASPTKLGEYLASGLIVVAEEKLGDLQEILVAEEAGCLIDSGEVATWPGVLEKALRLCDQQAARQNARRAAATYLSLSDGIERYRSAYEYAVKRSGGAAG
jgi:glycosyltransferase involved in cell wall biosynthesis